MKIARSYEVWVGGDLAGDYLKRDEAIALAKEELKTLHAGVKIVVDEIIHYEIYNKEDIRQLEKEI